MFICSSSSFAWYAQQPMAFWIHIPSSTRALQERWQAERFSGGEVSISLPLHSRLQTDQTPTIRASNRNTTGKNKPRWYPRRQSREKYVATNVQPELKEEEEAPRWIRKHHEGWHHEDSHEGGDRHWTNETLLWQTGRMYLLQELRSRRKHSKTWRPKQPKPLKEQQNAENAGKRNVFPGVKCCWNGNAETWSSHKGDERACHPTFPWWRYPQDSLYQQHAWRRLFYLGPIHGLSSPEAQCVTLLWRSCSGTRYGAGVCGTKKYIFNPSLKLVLYQFLHTVSSCRHETIHYTQKTATNTVTMVAEPLAPPATRIWSIQTIQCTGNLAEVLGEGTVRRNTVVTLKLR